jgi:hypothetical protein
VSSPSVLDAAQEAVTLTRRRLFPFQFGKWVVLGFLAYLDQCGRRGVYNLPTSGGDFRAPDLARVHEWLGVHILLIVALGALLLAVVVPLVAVVLWVNCRAIFTYLDSVATGRTDVGLAWNEHARAAHSLLAWRFGLAMGTLLGVLFLAAIVGFLIIGAAGGLAVWAVVAVLLLVGLLILFLSALASLALRDFVAPIQLSRKVPCGEAVSLFLGLLGQRPGLFLAYLLFKLVFHVALGTATLALCCLLCCFALVPVVSQTVLQPAFYFERAWSLLLLRQLGYDTFLDLAPSVGP